MPFTTLTFIAFFFVLFFAYYIMPKKGQWLLLLAGSMFFYGYASVSYLLLLWMTILVTYAGSIWMAHVSERGNAYLATHRVMLSRDERKQRKAQIERCKFWILVGILVVLLGELSVFKYLQFVLDNLSWLCGWFRCQFDSPMVNIILPVGLSFYVFQSMGYCIDVYRDEIPAERNILKHALFISYFPQVLQGPIGNYGRLSSTLYAEHAFDYNQVVFGLQRVAWGFFKKLIVANQLGRLVDPVFSHYGNYHGFPVWITVGIMYAVQLYADFSGYMDVACGCSQMLGIRLDENFNCPYFASSVSDFWRRWHMTLSSWFRDYLFYPILRSDWNGRMRKSLMGKSKYLAAVLPTSLALFIVWLATGVWHGASWGYIAWGVYYGILMILSVLLQPISERFRRAFPHFVAGKTHAVAQMIRTFAIVVVGYLIFRPADLSISWAIFKTSCAGMFWAEKPWRIAGDDLVPIVTIIFGVLIMLIVDIWHLRSAGRSIRESIRCWSPIARWILYLLLVLSVIYAGAYGSDDLNQFAYFKF